MCQRDQYLTSIILLTTSAAVVSSGLFILLAMGKIHKTDQLKDRNEITKKNNETVLPTNISTATLVPLSKASFQRLKLV
jgi:hypothetical protein